jgi:hypothetical protein
MPEHTHDFQDRRHNDHHLCSCGSPLVCALGVEELTREVKRIVEAFPNHDIEGHRSAHQKMIDAAIAQEKFWSELKMELAKKGVVGLAVILLGLVAAGFTLKVATALGIWKAGGG